MIYRVSRRVQIGVQAKTIVGYRRGGFSAYGVSRVKQWLAEKIACWGEGMTMTIEAREEGNMPMKIIF